LQFQFIVQKSLPLYDQNYYVIQQWMNFKNQTPSSGKAADKVSLFF